MYRSTRSYRSPELLLGYKVNYKTDIFSLGIILLELLLGYNPIKSSSIGEEI